MVPGWREILGSLAGRISTSGMEVGWDVISACSWKTGYIWNAQLLRWLVCTLLFLHFGNELHASVSGVCMVAFVCAQHLFNFIGYLELASEVSVRNFSSGEMAEAGWTKLVLPDFLWSLLGFIHRCICGKGQCSNLWTPNPSPWWLTPLLHSSKLRLKEGHEAGEGEKRG